VVKNPIQTLETSLLTENSVSDMWLFVLHADTPLSILLMIIYKNNLFLTHMETQGQAERWRSLPFPT
jgi:hypothetical protein